MEGNNETILYKTNQHFIVPFVSFLKGILIIALPTSIILFLVSEFNYLVFIFVFCVICILLILYNVYFWKKGEFIITNQRLSINVKNGFFSQYDLSIYFKNIKDIAYSKNNILHYLLNYGTFFARSGGIEGDFQVQHVPNIEKIYKQINYLYTLTEEDRKNVNYLKKGEYANQENINKTKEEIIEDEKINLMRIPGIKEVIQLNGDDRKFIFENEEDRNHGVYETIKRDIVLCVTHDSLFREADAPIVLTIGNKTIFPAVSFHEVKQKNTVSSSPGIRVHNYLISKFKDTDGMDATILIGFDM